jgi:hypothetical protein
MPKKTYIQLNSITLAAGTGSVNFNLIPQNFRDLVLVFQGTAASDTNIIIRFNSDSGSNYSFVQIFGNGSVGGFASGTDTGVRSANLLTVIAQNTVQIMDYSATDKHKTVFVRRDRNADTVAAVERWANTSAINSISLAPNSGTFNSGTSFALYGIEA